jgi:rare lipoprotein A
LIVCCAALAVATPGVCAGKAGSDRAGQKVGLASYYGTGLHGKKTAGGEVFDKNEMVAAHPTYPLGTRVRVTNLKNGRSQVVEIVDRGPAKKPASRGVIIDVSEAAAVKLGFRRQGTTRVRTEVLESGARENK